MMTAARNASAVREPTKEEFESFAGLHDILRWAGIKGNPELKFTQAGSLMFAVASEEFATIRVDEFASVDQEDFEATMREWIYSAEEEDYGHGAPACTIKPNAILKARARAAHRAARIWQNLEWSTAALREYTIWKDEAEMAQRNPTTIAPVVQAAAAATGDMVRMHETVDSTRVREVPMMLEKDRSTGLKLFFKLMHREPFPAEKPSLAQVTALLEILKCGGCYVDFALWGSFHIRTARSFRCRGLVVGPGNVLIEQELKGPPSFEYWSPSWDVFQCGMISADACIPPWLIAYHTMIKGYSAKYGEKCWPLLYQQDVRFRQEEMPEILYRENMKLEASILNNTWEQGVGLNTDKPWNHCWSLLLSPEVKAWWSENFKEHALFIVTGWKTVSHFLAGDANVSGTASGYIPSSGSNGPQTANTPAPKQKDETGKHRQKAKDAIACPGFNAGTCPGESGKACPRNSKFSHICSRCKSVKHSVLECPQRQSKRKADQPHAPTPWSKKQKSKGGGKQGRGNW